MTKDKPQSDLAPDLSSRGPWRPDAASIRMQHCDLYTGSEADPNGVLGGIPGDLYRSSQGTMHLKILGQGTLYDWVPIIGDLHHLEAWNEPPVSSSQSLTTTYQALDFGLSDGLDPEDKWTTFPSYARYRGSGPRDFSMNVLFTLVRGSGGGVQTVQLRLGHGSNGLPPTGADVVGPEFSVSIDKDTAVQMTFRAATGGVVESDTIALMARLTSGSRAMSTEGTFLQILDLS